jgi:hypothetical protein
MWTLNRPWPGSHFPESHSCKKQCLLNVCEWNTIILWLGKTNNGEFFFSLKISKCYIFSLHKSWEHPFWHLEWMFRKNNFRKKTYKSQLAFFFCHYGKHTDTCCCIHFLSLLQSFPDFSFFKPFFTWKQKYFIYYESILQVYYFRLNLCKEKVVRQTTDSSI